MFQALLPLDGDETLFRLRFTTLVVGTVCCPLCGLLFGVIWSLFFHFDEVTASQCNVSIYLPSVSAAVGMAVPERYVWHFCIGVHSGPRFLMAIMYWNYYCSCHCPRPSYPWLCQAAFVLSLLEDVALILLTFFSSSENYVIHRNASGVFVVATLSYMFLTCVLWRMMKKHTGSPKERKSYKWKLWLFLFNLFTFLMAMCFYFWHNWYCEPGVYTIFAFLEYLVVLSNMAFHMTAWWDFGHKELVVSSQPEDKRF
uniref:post-GPI attachment to proteins factor 2-like n=1 Tax=Euleptes europaea TaxID=460621 RepID=UPI0025414204|nr:post-GPI attachment to proteins factor 2-like [Euleptes europaea]